MWDWRAGLGRTRELEDMRRLEDMGGKARIEIMCVEEGWCAGNVFDSNEGSQVLRKREICRTGV